MKKKELFAYQKDAVETIFPQLMQEASRILLQAATGAGKTYIFADIVQRFLKVSPLMHIGILMHRGMLVRQQYQRIIEYAPELIGQIGFACASESAYVDFSNSVFIGTRQTVANRIDRMPPLDLLIIDECHNLPPKSLLKEEKNPQYLRIMNAIEKRNPAFRLLGVTATPYRLDSGYIYGDRCRPGVENWWDKIHYGISSKTLMELDPPRLSPMRVKVVDGLKDEELDAIAKVGGEYNNEQLGALMSQRCHIDSAVHAYQEYGEHRKNTLAFCVTRNHAEQLCDAFNHAGIPATKIYTGKRMTPEFRAQEIAGFKSGRYHVICNVGMLTEGWDCPQVDCILSCRPTLSAALYVQMLGRGFRKSEETGKKDCLLLDLSKNFERFGDWDDPKFKVPGAKVEREAVKPMHTCDVCGKPFPRRLDFCPYCGSAIRENEDIPQFSDVRMREEVVYGETSAAILYGWQFMFSIACGNVGMALLATSAQLQNEKIQTQNFLDFENFGSPFGRADALRVWEEIAGTKPPKTVAEALQRRNEIHLQRNNIVRVRRRCGKYEVAHWRV